MFWRCILSPRLYTIYKDGTTHAMYQPKGWEKWGDQTILLATSLMNVGIYTSPLIFFYIYRRGFFTHDEFKILSQILLGSGCFLGLSFLMRAYGRARNPNYMQFMRALASVTEPVSSASLESIRKFDFEFSKWPVTYYATPKANINVHENTTVSTTVNDDLPAFQKVPLQLLAFIVVHTFGLRLIYPGSFGILNYLFMAAIIQGRSTLVSNYGGKRAKVRTADNNDIDTMFVDKRLASPHGRILVVCCEGNSGYYEVGIMMTPINAGFSTLGWNHPGFGGSTGSPYPSQEKNAVDAVMQYAIQQLQFKPEEIVMFGWSIGGYSAAWGAIHYPVMGLILDATFDDLLQLALNHMPSSWSRLVKEVVRSYVDLHIAELVKTYNGPVRLVRRTDDEIICMIQGQLETNRGNDLVVELIKHRHADAIRDNHTALVKFANMLSIQRPNPNSAQVTADEKLVLTLLSRYMHDYKSTHCAPLPEQHILSLVMEIKSKKND